MSAMDAVAKAGAASSMKGNPIKLCQGELKELLRAGHD